MNAVWEDNGKLLDASGNCPFECVWYLWSVISSSFSFPFDILDIPDILEILVLNPQIYPW